MLCLCSQASGSAEALGIPTNMEQPVLAPRNEGYHNSPWEMQILSRPYFTGEETESQREEGFAQGAPQVIMAKWGSNPDLSDCLTSYLNLLSSKSLFRKIKI